MKFPRVLLLIPVLLASAAHAATIEVRTEADRVDVTVDGALFTSYKVGRRQKYPYFYPVNGPISGKSLTTESSEPYPHHHSLFFACDKVNGGNYWQEGNDAGQIVSQGVRIVQSAGDRVVFEDRCLWQHPGAEPVLEDRRTVAISAPTPNLRRIDFTITLEPLVEVRIEKSNHSLFAARVVPEISVAAGGTLINAHGGRNEAGTFGVASAWCDFSGTRDAVTEGIAIVQHPENRWYPCKWFTRDYGFFSPTPMYWLDPGPLVLKKGEALTLRYRVVVHGGPPDPNVFVWEAAD